MKIKSGVNVVGLRPMIITIIPIVNDVIRWTGSEMVITSAMEGEHMVNSLHPKGRAIDIRLPCEEHSKNEWVVSILQVVLGKNYDVVLEKDHIHIEYDPE